MKFLKRLNKPKTTQSILPFRLNVLLVIVFVLFALLIGQLAYLQLLNGSKFQAEVERSDKTVIAGNVPRGLIYDSKGRLIVNNEPSSAITYTRSASVKTSDMYQIANRLQKFIHVDDSNLTSRDKADYYLAKESNYKKVTKVINKNMTEEQLQAEPDRDEYRRAITYVKKQKPDLSPAQLQAAAIFAKMSAAYQYSTVYIKNYQATPQEVAQVSEHQTELPGIQVGIDSQRSYPMGDSMTSIIGKVSTEKQGLPDNRINELLAEGYSRNDRVGTSYLEQEYEPILKGSKSQTQISVGTNNRLTDSIQKYKGEKGDNLNLTIDAEYQKKVDQAVHNTFDSARANGVTQYSDGAYAVAINPKTGAILAMSGVHYNPKTGNMTDDSLGVINRTFVMGSAVKGATVLGGLMSGAISPENSVLPDSPIYLPSTPVKKSVYPIGTFGALSAQKALEFSSNIYMMRLAMRMGNAKYVPNSYIHIDDDIFQKLRGYYNQFGLGIKTGIDLPGESSGIEGPTMNSDGIVKVGSALDESYGNYDAYTLIQMAQYVSTIANGGYRMRPYLVQSIQKTRDDGSLGAVVNQTQPQVLNRVGFNNSQLNVVKDGFYNVVHGNGGWTTAKQLANVKPAIAGKTGTAQSFYYDPDNPYNTNPAQTITLSMVAYAPYNDPQIAVAVVMPNLSSEKGEYNLNLVKSMITSYFDSDTKDSQ
ncbi:MAG: penicillin-binding protein 2 [Lactobacillus sp.]|uniref:peptidoglycan D,D-transpeptidase FtsI family protein n=1 Tax=Bombilactobacillus bombi TaxID=1303590 RepID=UPI000E576BC5|nr:penicillin-binding protein 2 [Bombilactobacillus bombi]AXX64310.1 penicillin-binding protein 2 [Bombilactobacillus bombi]MCO6543067.1 penicillin-binding protein 2 [Lactobacillus sp.]